MDIQNKIRNIATKIMATLMSAIYLAVSLNVPVLADQSITGNEVIDGDAEVSCETGQVNFYGVDGEDRETDVSIGHDLTVTSDAQNTKGINVTPNSGQAATVTIGNDLTVDNRNTSSSSTTMGIEARPAQNGSVNIIVGNPDTNKGDVTVTGTDNVTGINIARNNNNYPSSSLGNTNITVRGDLISRAKADGGDAKGVSLNTSSDNAVTIVNIGGAVDANGIEKAMGLEISPKAKNTNKIDVGKGISASAAEATGVKVSAQNTSNTTINIGKDSSGNAITVISNGNEEQAKNSSGISADLTRGYTEGSTTATINVEGNIVVSSEVAGARGIYAKGGELTDLKIQVKGDVTSNGAGIYTENMSSAKSTDIIIDGTVKSTAENIPAVILDYSEGITNKKVNVTAWKIESNEGTALLGKNDGAQTLTSDNSQEAVAKCISYIIRVTQPEINNAPANVLSLANADGTAWNKKKAWDNGEGVAPTMLDVAGETEKVYVKLDVPAGYELVGVYADAEKTVALNQDENGSYYLTVPRGGGIDVNVALTLIQTDPDPTPNPQPDPTPNPQPGHVNSDTSSVPSDDIGYGSIADNSGIWAVSNVTDANEVKNAIDAINSTPAGGTAMIAITGDRLDAGIVAALLSRRDINVNIACFVNGRLCLIVIPANADLTGVVEADGLIRIAKLAEVFETVEM